MLSEDNFDEPEPPEDCMSLDDDENDDDAIDDDFDEPAPCEDHMSFDDDDDDDDDAIDDDNNSEEEFVELDPTGRYGRYAEVLGRGATKTVFKAYDMVDCKEVAWSKAKAITNADGPVEEVLAIEREIILLQRLNYKGIIKLFNAWVDEISGDTNFITELCSSTLLDFRLKHKHVSRKAVKSWARQILKGLVYLHTQDPPIIHRDLKSENIFVKSSSSTTLKIGDFGSAAILSATHHMHTLVGTPEFMAPEIFQEDYNELVDVYSFGMCMLELLTRECPFSECTSLAQIYKQVIAGKKPKALLKVKDVQALQFINRCLLPACKRPSAKELLNDPFLHHKEISAKLPNSGPSLRSFTTSVPGKLLFSEDDMSEATPACGSKEERINDSTETNIKVALGSKDVPCISKDASLRRSYQVVGTKEDENTLRLRIRIQESSRCSNIVFPFDLRSDTPQSVAEEMVRALHYPQSDMLTIADLISEELAVLASILKESLVAHTCSENLDASLPKQQPTDNVPICAASSSDTAFLHSNTPFEETASGSVKGCCEISVDEKKKEILHDNSSATAIVDASSDVIITSEPFKNFGLAVSGESRHNKLLRKSVALVSNERVGRSLAKRIGSLHVKSSSIPARNNRPHLAVKDSPNFKPSQEGIQRGRPLYVNTFA